MAVSGDKGEGLAGLAKRWLKTQLSFDGNPVSGARRNREADAIEREMEDRIEEEVGRTVVNTLMPESWKKKLSDLEHYQEKQRAESEQRRRAEHEARPRAVVNLSFRGGVQGELRQDVPVRVTRPGEFDSSLLVELEALDPIAIDGRAFKSMVFAIPNFAGAGRYDLAAIANGPDDIIDYTQYGLMISDHEEGYYWSPDYGPALFEVDQDQRTIRIEMAFEDSGSVHIDLTGTIVLP